MKTLALTIAFCVCAATASFAADDPMMGTWKLNMKKSSIAKGMGRNNTVIYKSGFFGKMDVTVDGVDAKGKAAHNEWSGRFDGKDYAVKGDPQSDMRAYSKVNDRTLAMTGKKAGKVVWTGRVMVSADGKTRTVTVNGTDAKGKKFKSTAVYDKQA